MPDPTDPTPTDEQDSDAIIGAVFMAMTTSNYDRCEALQRDAREPVLKLIRARDMRVRGEERARWTVDNIMACVDFVVALSPDGKERLRGLLEHVDKLPSGGDATGGG